MPRSRARSLSPEESARVCCAVQKLVEKYGTQALVAAELKMPDGGPVSQATVSMALRGAPLGVTFARAVAQHLGISMEELVSGKMAMPDGERRYRGLPGWDAAAAKVIEDDLLPPYIVEIIGDSFVSFATRPVDSALIVDLGMLWIKYAPAETRRSAANQAALGDRARRRAKDEARYESIEQSGTVGRESDDDVAARPAANNRLR